MTDTQRIITRHSDLVSFFSVSEPVVLVSQATTSLFGSGYCVFVIVFLYTNLNLICNLNENTINNLF